LSSPSGNSERDGGLLFSGTSAPSHKDDTSSVDIHLEVTMFLKHTQDLLVVVMKPPADMVVVKVVQMQPEASEIMVVKIVV